MGDVVFCKKCGKDLRVEMREEASGEMGYTMHLTCDCGFISYMGIKSPRYGVETR